MKINWSYVCGLCLIVLLVFVLFRTKMREGMATASSTELVSKGISNDITKIQDLLLISKYKNNYNDIVDDMIKWCDLALLQAVSGGFISVDKGMDPTNTKIITGLNEYSQFKNTLQGLKTELL
jgi:hypothetical protein